MKGNVFSLIVLHLLYIPISKSTYLRGRVLSGANETAAIVCRMVLMDTMLDDDRGNISQHEYTSACIPYVNGTESDNLIPLNLPSSISDANLQLLKAGRLIVNIINATLKENKIVTSDYTQFTVPEIDPDASNLVGGFGVRTGTMTVAIVRVSTIDKRPNATKADLEALFDPTKINFITQYNKCSMGNFKFVPSQYGVISVQVRTPVFYLADDNGMALVDAAQKVLFSQLQVNSSFQIADRILFCLPPGTGRWIASAGVNHWRAQFNDGWCTSLSATMHELGHTLGLLHSNVNNVEYGDSTSYMAAGERGSDSPLRCFNGQNNDLLGWYDARKLNYDPVAQGPQLVTLAAFVDFNLTSPDEPVLVNIADELFLQYNRIKSFNNQSGGPAYTDAVTITSKPIQGGSQLLAGLRPGGRYEVSNFRNSTRTLVIANCHSRVGDNLADAMVISVGLDWSLCTFNQDAGVVMYSQAGQNPVPPAGQGNNVSAPGQ